MKIKYWGVRGSVPAPLTKEQVREKLITAISGLIGSGEVSGIPKDVSVTDYVAVSPMRINYS